MCKKVCMTRLLKSKTSFNVNPNDAPSYYNSPKNVCTYIIFAALMTFLRTCINVSSQTGENRKSWQFKSVCIVNIKTCGPTYNMLYSSEWTSDEAEYWRNINIGVLVRGFGPFKPLAY